MSRMGRAPAAVAPEPLRPQSLVSTDFERLRRKLGERTKRLLDVLSLEMTAVMLFALPLLQYGEVGGVIRVLEQFVTETATLGPRLGDQTHEQTAHRVNLVGLRGNEHDDCERVRHKHVLDDRGSDVMGAESTTNATSHAEPPRPNEDV